MMYHVYIVEDHPITRRGYVHLIGEEPDLQVAGESDDALQALDDIRTVRPDVVVTDITLKGMSGLEFIKHLHADFPDLPVVVVSMHDETLYANRALQAGARGYVMKEEADTVIIEAIRRVLQGRLYVSDAVNEMVLHAIAGGRAETKHSLLDQLSDRELELFEHIGRGHSTNEAAEAMLISPKTVESYRSRIKSKLGIENNVNLIRRAVQWVERDA